MALNLNKAELRITAGLIKQFPRDRIPQAALAGRSNVGKSSLINSLLNRKSLARVSGEPGKTITVNFYSVDSALYLVDLPGYGYARRNREEQKKWSLLTDGFFTNNPSRDSLKLVCQLIDSRSGPSDDDLSMLEYLERTGTPHIIVATKTDKLNTTEKNALLSALDAEPLTKGKKTILYSAKTGLGRDELWNEILSHCGMR